MSYAVFFIPSHRRPGRHRRCAQYTSDAGEMRRGCGIHSRPGRSEAGPDTGVSRFLPTGGAHAWLLPAPFPQRAPESGDMEGNSLSLPKAFRFVRAGWQEESAGPSPPGHAGGDAASLLCPQPTSERLSLLLLTALFPWKSTLARPFFMPLRAQLFY